MLCDFAIFLLQTIFRMFYLLNLSFDFSLKENLGHV